MSAHNEWTGRLRPIDERAIGCAACRVAKHVGGTDAGAVQSFGWDDKLGEPRVAHPHGQRWWRRERINCHIRRSGDQFPSNVVTKGQRIRLSDGLELHNKSLDGSATRCEAMERERQLGGGDVVGIVPRERGGRRPSALLDDSDFDVIATADGDSIRAAADDVAMVIARSNDEADRGVLWKHAWHTSREQG